MAIAITSQGGVVSNVPQPCPCSKETDSEHTLPLAKLSRCRKRSPHKEDIVLSHANSPTKQGIGSNFPDKSHLQYLHPQLGTFV
jgi:hypothetical protein